MDWKDTLRHTSSILRPMRAEEAATAQGFHALHEAALAEGALSTKQKELIALAIAVSKQCVDCIGFHVKAAIRAGATRSEVAEMVNVCVLMNGGPGYMYGAKVMEAYDQLSG
ncbi:carboxymuconolactone decarboxylase family protein [Roseibacterium sp. SDUM158016]|jgi:AhpD family alkylhydroperoxidase|uniref:carboxymuconolactone decarboxylase family protein n=1 Tax=Roseicyclus sediminis TaxID=2980997 RepID=UPI0021D1A0E1|nr:carboxymuconolactone decarboxylase family protein [Roseibacterium sp. SDUM158016]MCU4653303.1 carboxymuconolactone decarboxylase family protein [Roseibacterium sp. SDUM158016]